MLEVEGYVRGFSRRRPDVAVTLLRLANCRRSAGRPRSDYFRLTRARRCWASTPACSSLHYDDLISVLHHATLAGVHGTFNVAGDGVLVMSQAIRRLGRQALPLPPFALSSSGSFASRPGWRTSRPSRSRT